MTTITTPARIASAGFEKRPQLTTAPSPPPPMSPAMTTIESANRIVWLSPRSSIRRDSGSCTFRSIWRPVAPIEAAASTVFTGTRRMPRAVMRMHGGIA